MFGLRWISGWVSPSHSQSPGENCIISDLDPNLQNFFIFSFGTLLTLIALAFIQISYAHLEVAIIDDFDQALSDRLRVRDAADRPEWRKLFPRRSSAYESHPASRSRYRAKKPLSLAGMIQFRWKLPVEIAKELSRMLELVVRDFVSYWYTEHVSVDPQFEEDVRKMLTPIAARMCDRLLDLNLPSFAFCDFAFALRHHIRWYSELKARALLKASAQATDGAHHRFSQEELNKLLSLEFQNAGHLHPATDTLGNAFAETEYLREVAKEFLVRVMTEDDYHCPSIRHLLREVLSCQVLALTCQSLTPYVINKAVVESLQAISQKEAKESGHASEAVEYESRLRRDPMFRFYCSGVDCNMVEGVLENLSNGSFVLWKRAKDCINLSIVCEATVQHRTVAFTENDTIESILRGIQEPAVTLGVCSGNLGDRNPLSSFSIKLIQVPWLKHSEFVDQEDGEPFSQHEDVERKLEDSASDLVSSAHGALKKEESDKLVLCLDSAVERCLAQHQANPKKPLNSADQVTQRLLEVLDSILQHGFDAHGMYAQEEKRTWWNFVKSALDLDPNARRGSNASSRMGPSIANQVLFKTLRKLSTMKYRKKSAKYKTGYPWMLISLQHEQLDCFLEELGKNETLVDAYYSPMALIKDAKKWAKVVYGIELLKSAKFHFDLNMFRRTLQLAKHSSLGKIASPKKMIARRQTRKSPKNRTKPYKAPIYSKLLKRRAHSGESQTCDHSVFKNRVGPINVQIVSYAIRAPRLEVESEEKDKPFVEYVIQCSVRRSKDLQPVHWKVRRRFRRFYCLHTELKRKYPRVDAKMPKRVLKLFGNFDKNFIEHRMDLLNKYLNDLVQLPSAGESREVLDFLSPDRPTLDHTEEEGKDDDDIHAEEESHSDFSEDEVSEGSFNEFSPRRNLRYSLGPDPKQHMDKEQVTLAELHIYNLLSEIFDFHEMGFFKKNLLTLLRTVIRLTLQNLLSSWIEENYSRNSAAELVTTGLQHIRESLWPNNEWNEEAEVEPTVEEEKQMREAALASIKAHLPNALFSLLGKEKAMQGAEKLHEFFQIPVCTQNLLYTSLDMVLLRMFPDMPIQQMHTEVQLRCQALREAAVEEQSIDAEEAAH